MAPWWLPGKPVQSRHLLDAFVRQAPAPTAMLFSMKGLVGVKENDVLVGVLSCGFFGGRGKFILSCICFPFFSSVPATVSS